MNRLFVVSGPSGTGKGSILDAALAVRSDVSRSISATTRKPRGQEVDGVNYHFLSVEEFRKRIDNGEFLEYAEVHGNFYGTLREQVDAFLKRGSLILEIDPQGAMNVRRAMPDAVLVFIAPPDLQELRERLVKRGTETPDQIERRMSDAVWQLERAKEYDEVIVNADLGVAVRDFMEIMKRYEDCEL